MKINSQIRSAISALRSGIVGAELREIFFPNGVPIPKEYAIWDYKESILFDKLALAEFTKDILSFYNAYGGYIFIGVSEKVKDEVYSITGHHRPSDFLAALRGSIESYSSVPIDICVEDILVGGNSVSAIYIPQRPASVQPAFLSKNGPDKKPGKPLFFEKSTYFRQADKTNQATIASQWEFLNSSRNPDDLIASGPKLSSISILSRVIPNNLPDRNLICPHLFGREDILSGLWAWLADELEPVRLLAGTGGKGKTSIAYEFASQFYRHAPLPFVQVLWLSAKKLQFRGDKNEYMELPEFWYSNPQSLLRALCDGTAALTTKQMAADDESEYTLQKKLRESLRLLPTFVVIDDIDSLTQPQQKRVFEIVQQVAAGAPSKFLLTTRANFAFSDSQCIPVAGLEGEPYKLFVADRLSRFRLPQLKQSETLELQQASSGSPLWTDSILRLMKQGFNFRDALNEWSGRPGEDARAAALKKELQALSLSARRILLAAALLRDCSRAELLEITKIGKTEFDGAIAELQTLFLVDAPQFIKAEPRFSVPESTAIAVKEVAADLVADHQRLLAAVREFTKRARAAGAGNSKSVGGIVNQTIALLGAGQVEKAVSTVDAALTHNPDNCDLLMLKGRCLRESQPGVAATSFNAAYKCGQRKSLLFDMWYEALTVAGDHAGSLDVANLAIDAGSDPARWLPLRARALVQIGLLKSQDGNVQGAVEMLREATRDMWDGVRNHRGQRQADEDISDIFAVNDETWKIARRTTGLDAQLLVFDFVTAAIQLGDLRGKNADRLLDATRTLVADVDLSADSAQSRASRTRINEAIRVIQAGLRQSQIPDSAVNTFQRVLERLRKLLDC